MISHQMVSVKELRMRDAWFIAKLTSNNVSDVEINLHSCKAHVLIFIAKYFKLQENAIYANKVTFFIQQNITVLI